MSLPLMESGRYVAAGSCVYGGAVLPLTANFRVLRQTGQLRINGYGQAGEGEKRDFRLRLLFATSILTGGRFEYGDERFRQLAGTLAWADDCYVMAGHCYAPNASVSVFLHSEDVGQRHTLRGMLSPAQGEPSTFALNISRHDPRIRLNADPQPSSVL
ncbi:MAG TPA: hypothetical protein VH105_08750 [Burkholderiales bacterium]|nr:hypothetical protein [Burkholderiales bacterium]